MRDPIVPTRSREQIAADNRAEVEGWIDERAADLAKAGVPLDEARRRAQAEFGDAPRAGQYAQRQDVAADRRVRALLWIEEFASDLRIAARTLARTPAVTAVVLLTFALGIGATTAVYSVVHAMLLRPLPYGNEASLVYLPALDNGVIRPGLGGGRHSVAGLAAFRERTTSFSGVAGVGTGSYVLSQGGYPEQVTGASVTPNTLEVLQASAAIGRTFRADEASEPASQVVVLLDAFWRRRFGGDSAIVGRTVEFDGAQRQIIGVMPAGFRVPTYELAEFLVPQNIAALLSNHTNAQVRFLRFFGRVKAGVTRETVQADIDRTMRALQTEFPRTLAGVETRVMPIRTAVAGDAKPRLLVLMGAAAFVLLIACANVAGILLARAMARRHELAVRIALGAGRRRLVRQFLAEGVVLAIIGGAFGLLFAQLGIGALRRIASGALPIGTTFALEPRVLAFAIALAVAAALASSLIPALGATRVPGIALRRDSTRVSASRASRRLRRGLVAAQLGVSVVLLVGAGLFVRTLHRLSAVDLGYIPERALTFRLQFTRVRSDAEQDVYWASLYEQLREIPGVVSVGGGSMPMSGQGTISGLEIENRHAQNERLHDVRYSVASDDYFSALGIPVLSGRTFGPADRDSAPGVAIVSAGLAKQLWPDGGAIGARVKAESRKPWVTVVGIVGDVRMGAVDAPIPTIYTSQRQDHWGGGGTVTARTTKDPQSLFTPVRETVRRIDPTMPVVGLRTIEDFRGGTPAIAERRLQLQLMLTFALIALAVSAIGVYGVSAYATEARRREFGIRMALGATQWGVLMLALRDGAFVAVAGALVGVPLAWLLASRMRDMLYAVAPFDPLTVGVVLCTLLLVVLAASFVPARRATLIDPARTMRVE